MIDMKRRLKAILVGCYLCTMMLWTLFTYVWFVSMLLETAFSLLKNFSHIISERNFNFQKNPPGLFGDVFAYKFIASTLLWRFILDVHSIYLIAKKCKLKWYDFLDGTWNNGPNSFFDRVLNHIFFFAPEVNNSKYDKN